MEKIVWTLIITLLIFTIAVIMCNIVDIQIQDSLITGFITVMSAELATMGGIQVTKVWHRKKSGNQGVSEDENKLEGKTDEP